MPRASARASAATVPAPVLDALARGALGDAYVAGTDFAGRMAARLRDFPSGDQAQLGFALRSLATPAGALALTGRPRPLPSLSATEVEALLRRWLASRIASKRVLARAAITVATGALYGYAGPGWERTRYPGPLDAPSTAEPSHLAPIPIERDEQLSCDVVVVGSGAGGSAAAAGLAARGLDVIVLEKGGYRAEPDFTHTEPDSFTNLYLYGSALATDDLSALIVAGSTLGGGTVVNYATAFRTPDAVLREWARDTGIDAFVSGEFSESLDAVAERVGVNTEETAPGCRDELMERGLRALGWHVDALPRATRGCAQDRQCGYCSFGCRLGAKQSSMRTFLADAANDGARMVVGADVRRIFVKDGRATGVGAFVGGHRLIVRARAVVAAGGSVETPALLLRSGIGAHRGSQIGRNLHLHPGTGAFGVFDEDVRVWEGTLQSRYSAEFRDRDGGYGPMFETVPIHPMLGAGAMPWVGSQQHRDLMATWSRVSVCGVLPRDRGGGTVRLRRDGSVRVRYRVAPDDERRLVDGVIAAGRVMEAAGAREVFTAHTPPISYRPAPGAHERWADEVRRRGVGGRVTLASFHQMGSCRMGTNPSTSAIDANNQVYGVRSLYVADASAFPTASGVNPMLTVYAIGRRAAEKIAAALGA